ncbi:MAG: sulfatase-like hydrolase/transferase, partial [Planctomycetota bacterium]
MWLSLTTVALTTIASTCWANPNEPEPTGADSQSAPRPNIIIVLVDDMGFSDIGCYGSEIETPNLDRLAANGLRFTQFYNSGRCCPTRASLMTGLHPHQVGIGHMTEPPERPLGFEGPYQGHLNDQCGTLASVLGGAGYKTMMVGKWHLGYHLQSDWPIQRGFERFYGSLSGAFNYFHPDGDRGLQDGNQPVAAKDDFYATDT